MGTLLFQLIGPMQSWGTSSRFDQRDTGKEPSKSGVIGLLAAALGIDRENWIDLEPITQLSIGIRHDRVGVLKNDYQTAQNIISANRSKIHPTAVTHREYLADAAFLVGVFSENDSLLEKIQAHLQNPTWPLSLGRKSYVPSESIWIKNGLVSTPLKETLETWPWISTLRNYEKLPEKLLISMDSDDGSGVLKMDQLLSSFSERKFGVRYVKSEWIPFPGEASHVS